MTKATLTALAIIGVVLIGHLFGQGDAPIMSPTLKAAVSDKESGRVLLGEKGLRRLDTAIRARMTEKSDGFRLVYTVTFSNDSYYDTESLETLLAEENSGSRRIEKITIRAYPVPELLTDDPIDQAKQRELERALLDILNKERPEFDITVDGGINFAVVTSKDEGVEFQLDRGTYKWALPKNWRD